MAESLASTSSTAPQTFSSLGLNNWLTNQLAALGLAKPTPIQTNCIPPIISGQDCIGCAETGSGKTAAFALPLLQTLSEDPYGIFALVLTPTRELAFQISEQFSVLGKPIGLKQIVITGGRDMLEQGKALAENPHIIVATPGRLADHIDSGTNFNLRKIKFLVLDEADRMLEDNFGDQLQTIFSILPKKRQTLLFSATMTETLESLKEVAMNKPFCWTAQKKVATVEQLDQRYVLMPADVKDAYMIHILDKYLDDNPNSLVMIFTATCKYCQILAMICKEVGLECVSLHSMIKQAERLIALSKFKSHQARLLIATDVASRGLDIPAVDLVVNHNISSRPKNYIHRVGRTARAGRGGMSITLVTQFDVKLLQAVEEHIGTKLQELKVSDEEVAKIATEVAVARREAEIVLDEQDFGQRKEVNLRKKAIQEGKDPDEVLGNKRKKHKTKGKNSVKKKKVT